MGLPHPKPGILDINPYVGGENKVEGLNRKPVRLASNENALGYSPKAHDAYISWATQLHRYPDGSVTGLREALAKQHSLPADQIVCGAGSDELISLLTRAYAGQGDEVVYSQYGFLMYPIAAKTVGAKAIAAPEVNLRTDIDALLKCVTGKTKIVFLANPNNPTGSYLTRDEIKTLAEKLPSHVVLVIDAAYAEFVQHKDYSSSLELVAEHENLVVLRTFSKIYGLAALRLGWAYCSKTVAGVLNRVRGPFNVNAPAQVAGVAALQDADFFKRSVAHNSKMLPLLSGGVSDLGFKVFPSAGNFVLAEFGASAEDIRLHLKQNGVFVRQMGAYGLPACLRITVGLEDEVQYLLEILAAYRQH